MHRDALRKLSRSLRAARRMGRFKSNALLVAIIASLLSVASLIAAEKPAKKYWVTDVQSSPNYDVYFLRSRFEMLETKWIEIMQEENVYPSHYEVRLSNGKLDTIRKDWVDDAITAKVLLPYDPVAKSKADAAVAEKRRTEIVKAKRWSDRITVAVLARKVLLGMSREQVETSWGKPQRIHRDVGSWGIKEQWIYGGTYLYFDNDLLTSYQDSK
jgi:hypothetical protein